MTPCNSCDNGGCGSCVADRLERDGWIKNAGDHCGCAEKGHKENIVKLNRPKVKSMFSKTKEETEPVEKEIVNEAVIED